MSERKRTGHEGSIGMKKPSSKIREEIARLQDQLRQAETREAERIGRIALKTGLGEIEIDETELQKAFEELAVRFRGQHAKPRKPESTPVAAGAAAGSTGEA
jgi:ribosomal protein L5